MVNQVRYMETVMEIHRNNFTNKKIVTVEVNDTILKRKLAGIFYKSFHRPVLVSGNSIYFYPAAVIEIPGSYDEYSNLIGYKSRNMIKKAEKNRILYRAFSWNDYLNDIFMVNTSAVFRQGRRMDRPYRQYPKAVEYPQNGEFKIIHIGGFLDVQLIGYIELYVYGNIAMTNRILGHMNFLNNGLVNGLFGFVIEYAIRNHSFRYLNYLTMLNEKSDRLSAFKYRVGFRNYSIKQLS
ncbi:MAG: hypothetical protein JXA03_01740 [Bacteroidales bacterium]|nr:hypothetical protein [Bacteroidales bacterium]